MYAATVYFGPDRMASEFLGFNAGDPWGGMAEEVLPVIGGFAVLFAILNSCLANASADVADCCPASSERCTRPA